MNRDTILLIAVMLIAFIIGWTITEYSPSAGAAMAIISGGIIIVFGWRGLIRKEPG